MAIRLVVYGDPVPQSRPKFYRRGSHVGVYTPKTSTNYRTSVAAEYLKLGKTKLTGPISLALDFYMHRPKRLDSSKHSEGPVPSIARPDWDNLGKAISDALNDIAYLDDSQIWDVRLRKMYHEKGGQARIELLIYDDGATSQEGTPWHDPKPAA